MTMKLPRPDKSRRTGHGQLIVLFAMTLPVLILFVGLAIDFGFAFVEKTSLSKAVDAAALAGMRNIDAKAGGPTPTQYALSAFNTNYGTGLGRDINPPVVNVAFSTNANNNTVVNVSATATIYTSFLRLLPGFDVLKVSSTSQVTRPQLIMSLVLDKSGSMTMNGGEQALPPAVINFLTYFDNNTDQVAEVSFSSIATTDVTIRTAFDTPITNAVNKLVFAGATFSQAGLLAAQTQINSVTTPAGEEVVKVAVFFTDGWANTVENTNLNCNGGTTPGSTSMNFGGCAPPEAAVGWCNGISFLNPLTGDSENCGATYFAAQDNNGAMEPLTPNGTGELNVSNDAMYRAVQVAETMQSQGIAIYSIGLGDKINDTFLLQIANDPTSPTYNPNEPTGQAVFAPTASDLDAVFQSVASEILLRISQ